MRLFIVLALAGLCLGAVECHAESATLMIRVKIISKADWDKIQANDSVTIDNFDDEPETFEFASNSLNVTLFTDETTKPYDTP